jgi:uncharacterized protein YodC (DUF2158 family)
LGELIKDEIKPGDTVQLIAGGPDMSVSSVAYDGGKPSAWCFWFEGKKRHIDVFPLVTLKRTPSKYQGRH